MKAVGSKWHRTLIQWYKNVNLIKSWGQIINMKKKGPILANVDNSRKFKNNLRPNPLHKFL